MSGAATNIERAPKTPGIEVTAPMALVRNRNRTLDCSTRPGRTPSCTEPLKSGLKRSANGSVAEGRFVLDSRGFGHHVDLDEGGLLMEAIWPCNTPQRLGSLRRPLRLFACHSALTQPAKSRPRKGPAAVGRRVLRKVRRRGESRIIWSVGGKHLAQRFWGIGVSGVSIPFARKWLKSSLENV